MRRRRPLPPRRAAHVVAPIPATLPALWRPRSRPAQNGPKPVAGHGLALLDVWCREMDRWPLPDRPRPSLPLVRADRGAGHPPPLPAEQSTSAAGCRALLPARAGTAVPAESITRARRDVRHRVRDLERADLRRGGRRRATGHPDAAVSDRALLRRARRVAVPRPVRARGLRRGPRIRHVWLQPGAESPAVVDVCRERGQNVAAARMRVSCGAARQP